MFLFPFFPPWFVIWPWHIIESRETASQTERSSGSKTSSRGQSALPPPSSQRPNAHTEKQELAKIPKAVISSDKWEVVWQSLIYGQTRQSLAAAAAAGPCCYGYCCRWSFRVHLGCPLWADLRAWLKTTRGAQVSKHAKTTQHVLDMTTVNVTY